MKMLYYMKHTVGQSVLGRHCHGIRSGEKPLFVETKQGVFGQKHKQRKAGTGETPDGDFAGGAYGRGAPQ